MSNKTQKRHSLDELIQKSRKNGYFAQLQKLVEKDKSPQKNNNALYRFNVNQYYAEKVKKPFKLKQQPQYKKQLQFFTNFQTYIDNIEQFENIKDQPPQKQITLENKVMKQAYSATLVHDPGFKQEVLRQKLKREKLSTLKSQVSLFPTKVIIDSRLDQHEQKEKFKLQSIYKKSTLRSPKKIQRVSKSFSLIKSDTQNEAKQLRVLQNLNRLFGTSYKKVSFKVSKQKLHQIITNKYGYDIITNFYEMRFTEDFNGLLTLINNLKNIPQKLAHALTFLTFDVNQDGIISEDDLMFLNNVIQADCPVLKDIYQVAQYSKKNNLNCQIDLPLDFIKYPTLKKYRKINNTYESEEKDKKLGIFRLFSLKQDDETEEQIKKQILQHEKEAKRAKVKRFRLNFEEFQKLFANKKPNLISQLLKLLTISQLQKPSQVVVKKKGQKREKKNPQKNTASFQLQNAASLLHNLKKENRNFETVAYK